MDSIETAMNIQAQSNKNTVRLDELFNDGKLSPRSIHQQMLDYGITDGLDAQLKPTFDRVTAKIKKLTPEQVKDISGKAYDALPKTNGGTEWFTTKDLLNVERLIDSLETIPF